MIFVRKTIDCILEGIKIVVKKQEKILPQLKKEVIKILPQVIVNAKVPNDRKNTLLENVF